MLCVTAAQARAAQGEIKNKNTLIFATAMLLMSRVLRFTVGRDKLKESKIPQIMAMC